MFKCTVCIVTYKYLPDSAGIARSASRLVKFLIDEGICVHLIVPVISDECDDSDASQSPLFCADNPEVDVNNLFIYRPKIKHIDLKMSKLMELIMLLDFRFKFDLFHGYWLPLAFPCLMIAASGTRPVIGSIRGNDAAAEAILPENFPYVQAVLHSASWITSVNYELIARISSIVDVRSKASVIINGIDSEGFPRWKGVVDTKGVVGTVGELRFKKAIPILVEAYSQIPIGIRKKLILGGFYSDAYEKMSVENVVKKYNLASERINTGYLERHALLEELTKLNVFVVCSYHDGLPNTLLEALACGVPIVASKVGGMLDVLSDGENALLVEPGNVMQLTAAIQRLLEDDQLCRKLSKGALKLSSKLDYDQEGRSWIDLYCKLLSPT